jgi:hypothetical protein
LSLAAKSQILEEVFTVSPIQVYSNLCELPMNPANRGPIV